MNTHKQEGAKVNPLINQAPPVEKAIPEKLSGATQNFSTSPPRKNSILKSF